MRYLVLALLVAGLATPADAQPARQNWCGQYLIGSSPNAPRAAVPSVAELARELAQHRPGQQQCSAGDILYVTMLEDNGASVASALCDYTKTITVEVNPPTRGGGTTVTCVWIGGMRGSR